MENHNKLRREFPEIWGGIECTINRVEDKFRDQLQYCGHYGRGSDIATIAKLGIKKLRYPVLWEYHQPDAGNEIDWSWVTGQLAELKNHNITPIIGLLHHGSGPAHTNLLEENFPEKFAAYAGKVALQFPDLEYYNPINEPLTTARFSGLYGLWYPHHRNEKAFIKMLLNQAKATILAMREIRKINPLAKLIQTEDLSKIYSTNTLAYQALYENNRRWLSFDLLCGKVDHSHYFYQRILDLGIPESELDFFTSHSCPPDIIGLNYYVTSERFLDDRIENYPESMHGGNGTHQYVDTEAVRTGHYKGIEALLLEVWDRYKLPLAITENQLSCSREEQLRWLKSNWESCKKLIDNGVDIRGFTAWALLGSFDWNSLLTRDDGFYEPGAFEVTKNIVRPTALARMISCLSETGEYHHPLIEIPGWWARDPEMQVSLVANSFESKSPVLIIGKNGTLARSFIDSCSRRFIPYRAVDRNEMDITNEEAIVKVIDKYRPWAIINASGYVNVDMAEKESALCFGINTRGPATLAANCEKKGIRLVTFSSDLVFGGDKNTPYFEGDTLMPLNVYGLSKAQSEKRVLENCKGSLIIRTSSFFGPSDPYNFAFHVINSLRDNREVLVASDITVSPTYVPDLVETSLDLLIDEETGIWHITNCEAITWADFAIEIANRAGYSKKKLFGKAQEDIGWIAQRPAYSALQSSRGTRMPSLSNALNRYFEHCELM